MTELTEGPAAENPAAAALALRLKALERGRIVVEYANRGVPIPEIAARIGVAEGEARKRLRDALARSLPETPEDFAAIQMSRLNEALLVAYSAMGDMNLKAVDRVIRIVRALDRYAAVLAARPLTRTPALNRDAEAAPSPTLSDDCGRSQIVAQGPGKVESRSLNLTLAPEAEARLPAQPAEAPAPDLARGRLDARPEIAPQPLNISRFRRGFGPGPASAAAALDPPGLAASHWMETGASVGALAAAGA
jgi:hypothetical protein